MKVLISISTTVILLLTGGCSSDTKEHTTTTTENRASFFTTDMSAKAFTHTIALNNDEEDLHMLGRSFFTIPWVEAPSATTARDGLGPLFSANTCVHCHPNNGAGLPTDKNGKISRALVMRLSISNIKNINNTLIVKNGFLPEPTYGGQFSLNGTSDVPYEGSIALNYTSIKGSYPDKSTYTLQKPTYKLYDLQYGPLSQHTNIAPHIALALIGLGALEKIPQTAILAHEDVDDKDHDGISAKANWVYNPESNKSELGRFTWKAAAISVRHQSANAAHNDMGLSNPIFPQHNCTEKEEACQKALQGRHDFDLPMQRLDAIAFYLKTLKIPLPKKAPSFEEGRKIFTSLRCVHCHVETYTTTDGLTIHPYSDLLLHDMGDALSDGHTIFKATENEFRTPPLWGLGRYKTVSGRVALLHDGRARSIEEAILWHSGEAQHVKEAFMQLDKRDRHTLLDFLGAL